MVEPRVTSPASWWYQVHLSNALPTTKDGQLYHQRIYLGLQVGKHQTNHGESSVKAILIAILGSAYRPEPWKVFSLSNVFAHSSHLTLLPPLKMVGLTDTLNLLHFLGW